MIKVLRDLFGNAPRAEPTTNRTPSASSGRPGTGSRFPAVSLVPSPLCCPAATQAMGKRVLFSEAPRLPLPACTMSEDCSCKFRKSSDRRDCDRRLFGALETNRWFVGTNNRKCRDRRLPAM